MDKVFKAWFFKLFFWFLRVSKLSTASAVDTLMTSEEAVVIVWKDNYGNVVDSEIDYTGTFFVFAIKMALGFTILIVSLLVVMPLWALTLVVRNFIIYK